jgi:hypothetical protein
MLIPLQQHTLLWIDNLIRPAAAFASDEAGLQGERLSGSGCRRSVGPALRPAVEVSCPFPSRIHQAKMLGFAFPHHSRTALSSNPLKRRRSQLKQLGTAPND